MQFETIHPFLDGNGRVGRLLITLLLCSERVLQQPLLYLSLYFKQHREAYYDRLQRVRTDGDCEAWLEFFLEGVIAVAGSAIETARGIRRLLERDRAAIHGLGRGAASALRVHELAGERIVLAAGDTATARAERADRQRGVRPARARRDPARGHRAPARPALRLRRVPGAAAGRGVTARCRPSPGYAAERSGRSSSATTSPSVLPRASATRLTPGVLAFEAEEDPQPCIGVRPS